MNSNEKNTKMNLPVKSDAMRYSKDDKEKFIQFEVIS